MNPRTDIINTLSYNLISERYMLPAKTDTGAPVLTDIQNIIEKSSTSQYYVIKLIDGDTIDSNIISGDIKAACDTIKERRISRMRPLFISYVIVLTSYNFEGYKQNISALLPILQKDDITISVTILGANSGEIFTLNSTRKVQTDSISFIAEKFKLFFSGNVKIYTRDNIFELLSNLSATSSKLGKINGLSATKILVAVNILIWILGTLVDIFTGNDWFFIYGAQHGVLILEYGQYWRLFSAMFLHADILHVLCNSYFLFVCGEMVEKIYGKSRFLILYFLSGLAGNVLSLFLMSPDVFSLGASGACMGLGGAMVYLWLRKKNNFLRYFQNMSSFILMIIFNLVYGFLIPNSNINNWAHLGGFVMGFLLGIVYELKIFFPKRH